MNKIIKKLMVSLSILTISGLTSCSKNDSKAFDETKLITRYTRDTESGTRDGFFTAIGFTDAIKKDSVIPGTVQATDNGNMISLINNDLYGIGYISLASSSSSNLKILTYNGVQPTEESVIDGTYSLSRNFNYITKTQEDCSEIEWTLIKGFLLFMNSREGLTCIKSKDGILTKSIASSSSFTDLLNLDENSDVKTLCAKECTSENKVTIKFGGSTSVEKIAKELTSVFSTYCPTFKAEHNHTGSGTAFKGTQGSEKTGVNSMHIGFLSRELNADEVQGAKANSYGLICKDGIVVAVNKDNTLINNCTKDMLKNIYSTNGIKWSDLSL